MGRLLNVVTPLHQMTKRDYLARMVDDKVHCMLTAKMRDQLFALEIPQRVLQLHQLNEQIVFGIQTWRVNRRLEVKRQPLLDAAHVRAPGQIEEQRDVEHNRRGKNAVAAQEVDLQLHRVPEPAEDVDVVPAFLPRRLCSTSR